MSKLHATNKVGYPKLSQGYPKQSQGSPTKSGVPNKVGGSSYELHTIFVLITID